MHKRTKIKNIQSTLSSEIEIFVNNAWKNLVDNLGTDSYNKIYHFGSYIIVNIRERIKRNIDREFWNAKKENTKFL